MKSLLPNILEVAERNNLIVNPKTLKDKEVRYKCPFCHADANRKNKFYLSLNEEKNIFKCWYCKESGGVLKFISLLEGKTEQELIEEVRSLRGSTYKKHPAERLTTMQLKLIGYPKINWIKNREFDYELYRSFREKVWYEWQMFVKGRKRFSYQILFVGLISGNLQESIKKVQEIEQELNESFLDELLTFLFKESKPSEILQIENVACDLTGNAHPYKTYLIDDKKNEEEREDFEMLNVCTFVGRLAKDVELKYTPNGKAVCTFTLALTRPVPDSQGVRQADFIRCIAWGKVAENMANQLSKGDTIGIQAKVMTRSYENQQGQNVYVTEFVVEGFPTFLKVKKWENGSSANNNQNRNQNKNQSRQFQNQPQNQFFQDPFANGQIDINDEDLPF